MSNGFNHSVKVPRLYKLAAKTVQTVEEEGASIKQLLYEKKTHPNLRGIFALIVNTIKRGPHLNQLLRKTKLLSKEPRLDPWLARILITELLWGKKVLTAQAKPIQTVLSYEKELKEELKNLDEADIVDTKKVQKPRYVRINTLVKSVEDTIASFIDDGWTLLPKSPDYATYLKTVAALGENTFIQDFHVPELLALPQGTHFFDHPGYKSGVIVLQDKASCLPAFFLSPPTGSSVLDMCSAPGMKTTHLAAIMNNKGKILAVERDNRRYRTLCEIVKKYSADCVTTKNADAMSLDPEECSDVEYILVDPSCSGSGMLDRINLGQSESKSAPGRLLNLRSFQVLLLRHALLNFPKAKRVVYSTCSMYPEENEMVVDEILEDIGDAYKLVPIKKLVPGWKSFSSKDYKCKDKCLYAKPEVDMSNGFFVAVFERNFEVPLPEYKRKKLPKKVEKSEGDEVDGNQENKKKRRWSKSKNESKVANGGEEPAGNNARGSKNTDKGDKEINNRNKKKSKNESVAVETPDNGEPAKKRKMSKPEVESNGKAEDQDAINELESGGEKKKKKKQSKLETPEPVSAAMEAPQKEGQKKKEKKKKNKVQEVKVLEDVSKIPKALAMNENPSEKKKKKQKK